MYVQEFCFTPAGPCVKSEGPDPAKVVGMTVLAVAALWGGYQVGRALTEPKPRPRQLRR